MRILYLDLDSTRADHLGCYGYLRNTTPNIDRIAKDACRFENYYVSDAPCLPSRTALFTGRFGIQTGAVNHGGIAADIRREGLRRNFVDRLADHTLPSVLKNTGYKTALISSFGERHSAWHYYAGFNEIYNNGLRGQDSAENVSPLVLNWLKNNAKQDDWFLSVNFWDPHTPYRAPESFGNPFEDDPIPDWITEDVFKEHLKAVGPHTTWDQGMYDDNAGQDQFPRQPGKITNLDELKFVFDQYDCGIKYMDQHLGQVFNTLDELGVLDETMIIISADHGENFGELGIYGEHGTADQATCRVPLIIKHPKQNEKHVDGGLHYHLDLAPTICEMLDIKPSPDWNGRSFASSVLNQKDLGREFLVMSQCAHVCQRSVRFGPWLYIRSYHDGFHLFPSEMLFQIEEDPFELHDLAKAHPEVCSSASYLLNQWHDEMMSEMCLRGECIDPLWQVMAEGGPFHAKGNLKNYCTRLKETGRGYAIPELKKRHPREFK